jgi:electron transfer flavoprotein alpha subunit
MKDIFVLMEHRQGTMRDVSLEMLSGAGKLGGTVVAVLLGKDVDAFAEKAAGLADKVIYINDAMFENYNSKAYQLAMEALIKENGPGLVLIANTGQGVDMAPALAVSTGFPLVTDVTALRWTGTSPSRRAPSTGASSTPT